MELRHLRYFVGVAEVENVSRAAEKLHISQPPLTRQIRQLEEELGVELFERTPRSMRLTAAGRVFEREARRILAEVDAAVAAAREAADTGARVLDLGYAPSLTIAILPRVLRLIQRLRPGTKTKLHDLTTAEMLRGLKERTLDFALTVRPGAAALRGCAFHEIHQHPAQVVLPKNHPLAERTTLDVADLRGEDVVAFTRTDYPEFHRWVSAIFKPVGRGPETIEEHDSITSLIAAVDAGSGITFGCDGFRDMAGDRVVVRPLAEPAPPIAVGLAWAEPPKHGATRLLADALADAFAD